MCSCRKAHALLAPALPPRARPPQALQAASSITEASLPSALAKQLRDSAQQQELSMAGSICAPKAERPAG